MNDVFFPQAYELDDRDTRLQHMMAEQDKNRRMNGILHEKIDKEVSQIKHQLSHERSLKLDAFQRVDDLQTCVSREWRKNASLKI